MQPRVGASWEGFVIEQILGELSSRGRDVDPYYFRTSDGHELDLVLDFGTERWVIEVKLTASPSPSDMNHLDAVADMIGASRRFLVSQTKRAAGGTTAALTDRSATDPYLNADARPTRIRVLMIICGSPSGFPRQRIQPGLTGSSRVGCLEGSPNT